MAREANELATVQQNVDLFSKVKADIKHFTPDYLSELGNVCRQTMYKYMRREPVGQRYEDEILRVIKKAKEAKENEKKETLRLAEAALA